MSPPLSWYYCDWPAESIGPHRRKKGKKGTAVGGGPQQVRARGARHGQGARLTPAARPGWPEVGGDSTGEGGDARRWVGGGRRGWGGSRPPRSEVWGGGARGEKPWGSARMGGIPHSTSIKTGAAGVNDHSLRGATPLRAAAATAAAGQLASRAPAACKSRARQCTRSARRRTADLGGRVE